MFSSWDLRATLFVVCVCFAVCRSATAINEISYILEDFDFNLTDNVTSFFPFDANWTDERQPYTGSGFLRTQSSVVSRLQEFPQERSFNCRGATHFSIRYRIHRESASIWNDTAISLRLGFFTACLSHSSSNCTTKLSTKPVLLEQNREWIKLSWAIDNDEQWISALNSTNGTKTNWGIIFGWEISTTKQFVGESDYFDYDHLACHGGSELLESTLYANTNASIPHDSSTDNWILNAHFSDLGRNQTEARLIGDGVLSVDYVVQQTQNWGGITSLEFESSGVYNLSAASSISFDYVVRKAASPTGHLSLRLILDEVCENYDGECTLQSRERFYSFHYILDETTTERQTIVLPLIGNANNDAAFWFTGWSGTATDKVMDTSKIHTFTWELSVDGDLGMNEVVTGAIDISNLRAIFEPTEEIPESCTSEVELTMTSEGWSYLDGLNGATDCCVICEIDPDCLFSVRSVRRDCGFASAIGPDLGRELRISHGGELEFTRDALTVSWMASKNNAEFDDYCKVCTCIRNSRLIDCSGQNLRTIPQTFRESWMPKTLNLGSNPSLAFIGTEALLPVAAELETIRFPENVRYLSRSAISDINTLQDIVFEGSDMLNLLDGSGMFGDVCCERGAEVELLSGKVVSFCNPRGANNIGTDALFLDNQEFRDYFVIADFTPSSVLMPQAAESPRMCAEYCKLNPRCLYFQHDARMNNSEMTCLLFSRAAQLSRSDEYADEYGTTPGLVAGVAPRARGEFEAARVLLSDKELVANESNDFMVSFEVTLGSMPQRGSVWIEPAVLVQDGLDVVIDPPKISLHDNETIATITVSIQDKSAIGNKERVLVVRNNITTCDAAFSSQYVDSERLQIRVLVSSLPDENTASLAGPLLVASAVMAMLGLTLCFLSQRRKREDHVWKVDPDDLYFEDPPVVLGRGTFGLVLLAEWRGTQVAVKRVLPPDFDFPSAADFTQYQRKGMPREQSKLRANFVTEMRLLSSLRHPNVTTVMGALVAGPNPLLVMELMDHGSLYDIIHNESMPLDGELILPILRDIAQGMRFLHVHRPPIIHGDLKAENCLVDSHFRAKVADFGLSAKETLGDPILLRGEAKNSTESDVYSFGIMLYELYSRSDPYAGEPFDIVLRCVCDPKFNKRPPIPKDTPPLIASLMKECYSPNQLARPSFEEIDKRIRRIDKEYVEPGGSNFHTRQKKSARNENLLHKVFPKHVADALRDGRTAEPDRRDLVSVFFSDIVGFTEISSSLPADKLTDMLDRLYTKMDNLADKYGVFKIDVVGDAYMCATNLATDQPNDHTKRIAEFSIEAIAAAKGTLIDEESPSLGYMQIRCGFHAGPVVAQVVGQNTPKYSVFGDAVNCASQMESSSAPGCIQCSSFSADLLKIQAPHIPLRSRGMVSIKGKGSMNTYFVNPPDEEMNVAH